MTSIAPHLTRAGRQPLPLGDATPAATGRRQPRPVCAWPTPCARCRHPTPSPAPTVAHQCRRGARPRARPAPRRPPRCAAHWDGQLEDDARLVTAVARTAAGLGADIVTRCSALAARRPHGAPARRADRATLRGARTRRQRDRGLGRRARASVSPSARAAGRTSSCAPRRWVARGPSATPRWPGSSGAPSSPSPSPTGSSSSASPTCRLTDVDPIAPAVPDEDVHFLLDTINGVLSRGPLERAVTSWAATPGLRPLVRGPAVGESADVSRRHLLLDEPGRPGHDRRAAS